MFKVGDKVRSIQGTYLGEEGSVTALSEDSECCMVQFFGATREAIKRMDRLEKVEIKKEEPKVTFSVGDRVKSTDGRYPGQVGEVLKVAASMIKIKLDIPDPEYPDGYWKMPEYLVKLPAKLTELPVRFSVGDTVEISRPNAYGALPGKAKIIKFSTPEKIELVYPESKTGQLTQTAHISDLKLISHTYLVGEYVQTYDRPLRWSAASNVRGIVQAARGDEVHIKITESFNQTRPIGINQIVDAKDLYPISITSPAMGFVCDVEKVHPSPKNFIEDKGFSVSRYPLIQKPKLNSAERYATMLRTEAKQGAKVADLVEKHGSVFESWWFEEGLKQARELDDKYTRAYCDRTGEDIADLVSVDEELKAVESVARKAFQAATRFKNGGPLLESDIAKE